MKRTAFGTAMLILISGIACAQPQLSLQKCLEAAKSYSLRGRAAVLAIRTSELSHEELSKTALPQFKVSSELSYAPTSGKFGYDPAITDGGQVGGRVSIEQSLYDGGARNLRLDHLRMEQSSLITEKKLEERDLVYSVKELFIEALRSQRAVELEMQSAQQLRDYLDLVERLAKGGASAFTDVLKTQVQLRSAERAAQKAGETLAAAKLGLAELMGGSIDTAFTPDGPLESLLPAVPAAKETGLPDVSLDIALAELNVQKSTFETELVRSERRPVVSALADAGVLTSLDNLRLSAPDRAGVYGYMVGITVEVPLFAWGATDLRIQQRELATQALTLQLEGVRRSVTTEFRKTLLQISNAEERLRSIRSSLTAAEENFLLTKAKYAAGGVSSLEVLSAQQLLTDLRLEELETVAEGQLLLAKLEQITSR